MSWQQQRWQVKKDERERRLTEKSQKESARAGTRKEEWMCGQCGRTNYLLGVPQATLPRCRGADCNRYLNVFRDSYINQWACKTDWPQHALHVLGLSGPPLKPPPPKQEASASPPTQRSWTHVVQGKQASPPREATEPSLQQKLETARQQLNTAQHQGWDDEAVAFLKQRVDTLAATLTLQQPVWQRLNATKKRLRTAADRVEAAAAAVREWTAELNSARMELTTLKDEHASLEAEAASSLGPVEQMQQQTQMTTMVTTLQTTLRTLAAAVDSLWIAGDRSILADQGGVPGRLAQALQATHATLAQLPQKQQEHQECEQDAQSVSDDDEELVRESGWA